LCLAHYAADNGYPYLSLGKILIEEGAIPAQEMSLHRIRYYFQERPSDLTFYLWRNKRYIFFRAVCPATAPVGSLGLSLTAGHSIATDPRLFPPGGLALLLTSQPVADAKGKLQGYTSLQRLVLNQDSGSAIQGPGRVDFFWGSGKDAEFSAGYMKQTGALFFLIQRKTPPSPLMVADK
jgi:membrane-bound lytic murein transglycosylase A